MMSAKHFLCLEWYKQKQKRKICYLIVSILCVIFFITLPGLFDLEALKINYKNEMKQTS